MSNDKLFYFSKSRDVLPGKGLNEIVENHLIYNDLAKIKDWRKILSNFHIFPFIYEGNTYNTIEHAFQAKKINIVDNNKIYTFNQHNRMKGNNINVCKIDTAMVILPYKLCKNVRWILNKYEADGYYIEECYNTNPHTHVYVDNDLCFDVLHIVC
jgi:hypothetical protein